MPLPVSDLKIFIIVLQYLNTNHTLYNAVIKAEQEGNLLTDEAHRAAHYLHLDFERSGIHLSAGTCSLLVILWCCYSRDFVAAK